MQIRLDRNAFLARSCKESQINYLGYSIIFEALKFTIPPQNNWNTIAANRSTDIRWILESNEIKSKYFIKWQKWINIKAIITISLNIANGVRETLRYSASWGSFWTLNANGNVPTWSILKPKSIWNLPL